MEKCGSNRVEYRKAKERIAGAWVAVILISWVVLGSVVMLATMPDKSETATYQDGE